MASPRRMHPLAGPAAVILVLLIAAPGLTRGGQGQGATHGPQQSCPNPHQDPEFTGNGANQSGAYNTTCDGSPSQNGQGGGGAQGKPCAGCVGNADNKNPPGQDPQGAAGADPNAGYECDRNQGVGQTNPAHSGCAQYPIQ